MIMTDHCQSFSLEEKKLCWSYIPLILMRIMLSRSATGRPPSKQPKLTLILPWPNPSDHSGSVTISCVLGISPLIIFYCPSHLHCRGYDRRRRIKMHLFTNFVPHILSFFILLLILLILVAGSNKHVLVDWYFLKVNLTISP
jgi:hypothetical protein